METPEAQPKNVIKLSDLLAGVESEDATAGMSLTRYQTIHDAKESGTPIGLSSGEQASYERAQRAVQATNRAVNEAAGRVMGSATQRIRDAFSKPLSVDFGQSVRAVTEQQAKIDRTSRPVARPATPVPDYVSMSAAAEEIWKQRKQQEDDQRELQKRQTDALEAIAVGAEESGKLQTRFNWAILAATVVGVLVGGAALLVTLIK